MFSKKKEPKRRPRPAGSLAQYGIFEVPESIEDIGKGHGVDDNDEDLEAELAALTTGGDAGPRPRKAPKRIPDAELNAMISDSMKDINSDEELSGDENDPDLLDELQMLTGGEIPAESPESERPPGSPAETTNDADMEETIKLLEERLTMYTTAQDKAKTENSTSKARRYERGVKTLQEKLSMAKFGKKIDIADIPPVLPSSATSTITEKSPAPEPSESETPPIEESAPVEAPEPTTSTSSASEVDQETLNLLKKRQQEYRIAAVAWKKAGHTEEALQHVKLVKQFDLVIAAISAGNVVDLADMPDSPKMPETTIPMPSTSEKEESETQQATSAEEAPPQPQEPLTGSSLESALKERLEIYRRTKVAAECEGNTSKARRYGRICKQFEDALKMYARGKPVALDELPTPPGFTPLAVNTVNTPTPQEPTPKPAPEKQSSPKEKPVRTPIVPPRANADKKQKMISSRADKQMMQIQQRQQEFKLAALKAKKEGDLELARDYLRQAKGLDPLIEASKSGLPVDMNSIPLSPEAKMQLTSSGLDSKLDEGFDLISKEECLEEATGTDDQIYDNLEAQLLKQIKWCLSTRDHCKALGDVPGYNRWERLALGYTRDLDMLRVRKRNGSPPPQHHYEIKTYAIVQSCTDLNDGDLELSIIRGVNYPKEADTYVIFEFPYPTDSPMTNSTSTVRDTSNPEYEAVFPLNGIIERSLRQCQRAFKRHALKCQVWSKGGFFKRDSLLGIVTVKLQPLETQCILHDSFPLMDGRKATGGKLEVKMRVRNPILTKQIDQITDKWLTIDH